MVYVSAGVNELDEIKLGALLKLRCNKAIADALILGFPIACRKRLWAFSSTSIRVRTGFALVGFC